MHRITQAQRLLGLGILGAVLLTWLLTVKTPAQPAKEAADPPPCEKNPTPFYFGTVTCQPCHTSGAPAGWNKSLLCRCTEFGIWNENDKHPDAFKNLRGDRGKRMAANLGYDVTTAPQCLGCHGIVIKDDTLKGETFNIEDGVSCVVCHGAFKEWRYAHADLDTSKAWRAMSRAEKEKCYGMTDLWDPVKRAAKCASCHIGDPRTGLTVTHEMYAAGHPPLPGFEASTFSREMPRHWELLREKLPREQKLAAQAKRELQDKDVAEFMNLIRYDGKEREETKLLLVGAAVSLRESMRLLEADASANPVLDLAQFDCYACHHDLKSPSWRQERGTVGRPGRPRMRGWPTALIHVALAHTNPDAAAYGKAVATFAGLRADLEAAFDARPFGDSPRVKSAASALAQWADRLAQASAAAPCEQADVVRLLQRVPELFKGRLLDYDEARQLAWALQVLYEEAQGESQGRVKELLASLAKEVKLKLPSGKQGSIEKDLPGNLQQLYDYDPKRFGALLADLPGIANQK